MCFSAYWGVDIVDVSQTTYHFAAYENIYYIKNVEDLKQLGTYIRASYILIDDITLSDQCTSIPVFMEL